MGNNQEKVLIVSLKKLFMVIVVNDYIDKEQNVFNLKTLPFTNVLFKTLSFGVSL